MKSNYKLTPYFLLLFLMFLITNGSQAKAAERYYYQLKVYHLKNQVQEDRLDNYLQNAYLPAMHRAGISNVGVFKPVAGDTARRVYVLIPFKTWKQLEELPDRLTADVQYLKDGADYINAPYTDLSYNRIETIVLRAFPKMTEPAVPQLTAAKIDRVYELRSYESPSEAYNINKVKMFNDGDEVALFKRLGFNAVFYSEVLAGSHMPNLMYMVTFNSMADHDKLWKTFGADPYWKELSAKPEYQNNVNHIDAIFLHPTAYSDF